MVYMRLLFGLEGYVVRAGLKQNTSRVFNLGTGFFVAVRVRALESWSKVQVEVATDIYGAGTTRTGFWGSQQYREKTWATCLRFGMCTHAEIVQVGMGLPHTHIYILKRSCWLLCLPTYINCLTPSVVANGLRLLLQKATNLTT